MENVKNFIARLRLSHIGEQCIYPYTRRYYNDFASFVNLRMIIKQLNSARKINGTFAKQCYPICPDINERAGEMERINRSASCVVVLLLGSNTKDNGTRDRRTEVTLHYLRRLAGTHACTCTVHAYENLEMLQRCRDTSFINIKKK